MRMSAQRNEETLLSLEQVLQRLPIEGRPHRVTLWRWINQGVFPQPLRLGLRKVRWRESDVDAWLAERK
ncbi:MAG: AlpA family phage regulatory protein [Candidatus Binatus sp.]